ncbi:hypothetical protein [Arthrobacter flavus]|uniref:Uncharacterized protein n=1 Tax=Arthrobacter flavus TaxID=95172 RepID=A0ABW4QBL6_9MICC
MDKHHKFLLRTATFGIAIVAISGCSSSPEENVSQTCEASEAYATALKNFEDTLTMDATIDEIRSARDEVSAARDDLVDSSEDVTRDRVEELDSAQDEFSSAVNGVPDDATLAEATESLEDEIEAVKTARSNLESELTC